MTPEPELIADYVRVSRADLKLVLDLAQDQMVFRQNEWLAFHRLLDAATEPEPAEERTDG